METGTERAARVTVVKDQMLITAVILLASVSHRLTLEIVGIGADRADVVLIMIALIGDTRTRGDFSFHTHPRLDRMLSGIACRYP